jgi:DNA-binding FadR family transcriptional regulator
VNRRTQILDAIKLYKERHGGNSPSERELAELVGVAQQVVNRHLVRMEHDGLISRPGKGRRAIVIEPEQMPL